MLRMVVSPARWDWIALEDYVEKPSRGVDERPRHYQKAGRLACAKSAQDDLQAIPAG
jgi:hypothetical protein